MAVVKDIIPSSLTDEAREVAAHFIELQHRLDTLIVKTPRGEAQSALIEANIHAIEAAASIHWHCAPCPRAFL